MSTRPGRGPAVLAGAALAAAGAALADRHDKLRRVPVELRVPRAYLPLPISAPTLPLVRAITSRLPAAPVPGVAVQWRTIPGADGSPGVRLVIAQRPDRPKNSPALLWLHGGGFVMGSGAAVPAAGPRLAHELNALVVGVDYRLAPEHPAPAALDDCAAALSWLHEHAADLGIDPGRLAVGGESAGGALAAALAQRAHDEGRVPVAFQALVYPMLDDRTVLTAPPSGVGELLWTPSANRFGWRSYLGVEPGADAVPGYAVPARRGSLEGLPPAWIGVGDRDLFHAEDLAYAERLRAAGVDVILDVIEGLYHGADAVAPDAPQSRALWRGEVAALRRGLGLDAG